MSTSKRTGKHQLTTSEFDERMPTDLPPFTLDELKAAIPAHCFERPFLKSFSYLLHDVIVCSLIFVASLFIQQLSIKFAFFFSNLFSIDVAPLNVLVAGSFLKDVANPASFLEFGIPSNFLELFGEAARAFVDQPLLDCLSQPSLIFYNIFVTGLWIGYILLQGIFMTGIWVIGHECGHRGFHANPLVADTVGLITHSFLLVPYHSWRISHRTHHSHNGDLESDTVHNPAHINAAFKNASHGYLHNEKWEIEKTAKSAEDLKPTFMTQTMLFLRELDDRVSEVNFFYRKVSTFLYSTFGWIFYLIMNVHGRRYPNDKSIFPPNHFFPSSPLFKKDEAIFVIISDIALLCYIYLFYRLSCSFGFAFFAMHYLTAYFVTNFWLVLITALQHAHPGLPRFSTERWNYLQGALATVDRDYGAFLNYAFHNIQDTHVCHHLFSYLPHYHAMDATNALRTKLGKYYIKTVDEAKPFGTVQSFINFFYYFAFVAEDNHPALAMIEAALDAKEQGKDEAKAVDQIKEQALANGPHVNGRNVEKEVYWFRSLNF